METHPLNLAHQQHRRAEAHLRYKRFDEAMQCHHNAAELLIDAMKSTTSSFALESISLQHSYHLKQKDIIKSKKEQYERVKKAVDTIRHISKDPQVDINVEDNSKLQIDIYRNINDSNTLLNTLLDKKIASQVINKHDKSETKAVESIQESIVNELQILGQNLHSHVEQLMMQVELQKDENMILKERVDYLEKERAKYLNIQSFELPSQNKFPTHNVTMRVATAITSDNPRNYNAPPRPQQPHFDLSAFKDD